jgi:lipoate-protein ligase B
LSASVTKSCYFTCFPEPIEYGRALDLQMRVCGRKKEGFAPDVLLLLEHPPVITMGRNGDWQNLVVPEHALQARGVSRFQVDRGGDITFHGPGQLVGYPLLKLEALEQDVHRYMRNLEEAVIGLLDDFGIPAGREQKHTGVWTNSGKVCAMGVHISRWVTRHGLALNVNTDLDFYDLIVPCGLRGRQVTSMKAILGREMNLQGVADGLAEHFGRVFQREMTPVAPADLENRLQIFRP